MAGERSMSAATSLQARVERYLVERRRLGFSLRRPRPTPCAASRAMSALSAIAGR